MKVRELFEETIRNKVLRLKTSDLEDGYLKEDHSKDILNGQFFATDLGAYELVSLRGIYKRINGSLDLEGCKGLESLEYCPKIIGYDLDLGYCTLDSLEYCADKIGNILTLRGCENLTSLEGIGREYCFEVGRTIYLSEAITSHLLGILKIEGLDNGLEIPYDATNELRAAAIIINRHLKSGRNINKCKSELKEAGLEEYAQL